MAERPPYLNFTSSFNFHLSVAIGMKFCVGMPNFIQIDQCTYHFFQDGGHKAANLPAASDGARLRMWQSNLHEISQSTAEILLFPVMKTNGRDIGIPLPVSICTYLSSSAFHFASACQILSKSNEKGFVCRATEAPKKLTSRVILYAHSHAAAGEQNA